MDVSGTPCGPLAVMGDPFQGGGNATHYLHEGTKTSVRVDSKGNVVMHQTKQLQAHCTSTVDGFSSVLYYCSVILIPWNYKGSEVNIHGAIDVAGLHNASWDASHIDMHLDGGTEPFMEFSFMLKRKYETSWDRPTAAVVITTLIIFWLPSSPPKITLGGVSLLLTTFLIDSVTKEFTGFKQRASHRCVPPFTGWFQDFVDRDCMTNPKGLCKDVK
ncbi:hypothetical protein HPB47_016591 [Ixodes persulcatus]|uniref:Uncharacterized protein n=1 Tax=Ixodes persulcatus TaxID=34615 RepID=A0AC60QQI2_IXOPE|nr:hypothetical protein HPB47_016591 [Ixodes persulcatus]